MLSSEFSAWVPCAHCFSVACFQFCDVLGSVLCTVQKGVLETKQRDVAACTWCFAPSQEKDRPRGVYKAKWTHAGEGSIPLSLVSLPLFVHPRSLPLSVSLCLSHSLSLVIGMFTSQYITVYKHLSQMHQRIRVGSSLPQTELHLSWSQSVVERHHGWKRSETFERPRQQQLQQPQKCEQTWSPQQIWSHFSSN